MNENSFKMKFLILYIFTINIFLRATTLVETNQFIKPVVNLNEFNKDNQEAFIAFEGTPGNYKSAQLYTVNAEGEPIKTKGFSFDLPKSKASSFFSAHLGSFIETKQKHLVITVKDPTIGTKLYVWRLEEGALQRQYEEPYIINPEQPLSQPGQSIKTQSKTGKENLIISFGSPNRNLVMLSFQEKTVSQKSVAQKFLQNQAGKMFIVSVPEEKEIFVFNEGEPTQNIKIIEEKEETNTEDHNTEGRINQVFLDDNKAPLFLVDFNKLYFTEDKKTVQLNPKHKHEKIFSTGKNKIVLIDSKGRFLTYQPNNQMSLIEETPSLFNNQTTTNTEVFSSPKETTYLSVKIEDMNYFITNPQIKKPKTKKEGAPNTKQDTTIFHTNEKQSIPIILKKEHEFLELNIEEQPKTLSLNLEKMSFLWEPEESNIGYNTLKYNIVYNVSNGIVKKEKAEGKIALNKEVKKETHTNTHTIYVNTPPTLEIEKKDYTVQLGHTLEIPLFIADKNTEQTIKVEHSPTKNQSTISNNSFIWTPTEEETGPHTITFIADDGYRQTKVQSTVFVDALKETTKDKKTFLLTTNKEFVLDVSTTESKKYEQIEGPENSWVSPEGIFHWIPIATQLGENSITIERKGKDKTENYILSTYVNSPPVISYRPDKVEYISYLENFDFQLKSFDANTDQQLYWSLKKAPKNMKLNANTALKWKGETLDHNDYTVEITDSIDTAVFNGSIYVNDSPKIISKPKTFIQQGDFFNYEIVAEDLNKTSFKNSKETNVLKYALLEKPKSMLLQNNKLEWQTTTEDVGSHSVLISVTDGIETAEQHFLLNVNDIPTIISPDSIYIMVGDTLNHTITAADQNKKTELTYSIRTQTSDVYLNAQSGQITWVPTNEDVGNHTVEVAVSDGFDMGTNVQQLTIIVSSYPSFLIPPPTEAFVDLDYLYYALAQDGNGNQTPNEDVFVKLVKTTFSNLSMDTTNYMVSTTPTLNDLGEQTFTLKLSDKNQNNVETTFKVLVLENSPCEPENNTDKQENKKERKTLRRIYEILLGVVALVGAANQ